MQRTVTKVINALRKKGMTRAFIEIDDNEYIYPQINDKKKMLRRRCLAVLIMAAVLTAGIILIFPSLKSALDMAGKKKDEINRVDTYGMSVLHHAVIRSDIDEVKRSITAGARVNIRDDYGWTPLHWAVFTQNSGICRYLLLKNASIEIRTRKEWFKFPAGITPVEMARIVDAPGIRAALKISND